MNGFPIIHLILHVVLHFAICPFINMEKETKSPGGQLASRAFFLLNYLSNLNNSTSDYGSF